MPGTCLWALLPLIATTRLGLGPRYGVLLPRWQAPSAARSSCPRSGRGCRQRHAAATSLSTRRRCLVAVSRNLALTIVVLLPTGVAWITFLSNVNAALQLFLPKWVRARGLAVYQMVLFGGQAAGAVIWGAVAGAAGLVPAFLISAVVMAGGAATILFWPFQQVANMDRSLVRWPDPHLLIDPGPRDGPVLVRTTYTIRPARSSSSCRPWPCCAGRGCGPGPPAGRFTRTPRTRTVRRTVRRRELGRTPPQHRDRQTGTDLGFRDAAAALSSPPPQTEHYLAAAVHE